jgi:hypothetical protein
LATSPTWSEYNEYRRKPKTNAQIACELLDKAYDALEAHSVEICEPNVDHIQRLVLDAKLLLQMPEDKPVPTARRHFTCSVSEGVTAASPDDAAWYLREVVSSGVTPVTVCDQWGNEYTKVGIRPKGEQQ